MANVAIFDACVLYSAPLRDFLLRLGRAGVVQPRWSDLILDECFRSILQNRPDLSEASLARTRTVMNVAFPSALVEGFEQLIAASALPDADDRHVLAAALHSHASTIVTFNLKDFPASVLEPLGVAAVHPDDFVLERIADGLGPVQAAIAKQAADLTRPPGTIHDVLERLQDCGLPRSVAKLRAEIA